MSLFDGVTFAWDGRTVSLPADRLLGALARLEEHVSLDELAREAGARYARLSRGFAAVLRFAGIPADDEAVYSALLTDLPARKAAGAALTALLDSARPPASLGRGEQSATRTKARLADGLFKAIVGSGWATASEFRSLHPQEAWLLLEAKRPARMITDTMTEDEAEAIYREAYGTEDDAA